MPTLTTDQGYRAARYLGRPRGPGHGAGERAEASPGVGTDSVVLVGPARWLGIEWPGGTGPVGGARFGSGPRAISR